MTKNSFILYNDTDVDDNDIKEYFGIPQETPLSDSDISFYYDDMYNDLKEQLHDFNKQANKFLMTGSCGLWYGRQQGGKVLEDLMDLINYLHDYAKITFDDGVINVTTYHHDGTNYYQIRPLSSRGEKYFDNHYYTMSDDKLHDKLQNVKGMLRSFKCII